jgi:hypothetical protein
MITHKTCSCLAASISSAAAKDLLGAELETHGRAVAREDLNAASQRPQVDNRTVPSAR